MPSSIISSASTINSSTRSCIICTDTVSSADSKLKDFCPVPHKSARAHAPCLANWLIRDRICPMCRTTIDFSKAQNLIDSTPQRLLVPISEDDDSELRDLHAGISSLRFSPINEASSFSSYSNSYSGSVYAGSAYNESRSVTPTQETYDNSQYSMPQSPVYDNSNSVQSFNVNTAAPNYSRALPSHYGSNSRQSSQSSDSSSSGYSSSPAFSPIASPNVMSPRVMSPVAGQSFYGAGSKRNSAACNQSATSFGTTSSRASTRSTASSIARHTLPNGKKRVVVRSKSGSSVPLGDDNPSIAKRIAKHVIENA